MIHKNGKQRVGARLLGSSVRGLKVQASKVKASKVSGALFIAAAMLSLTGCGDDVGKVSLGLFTTKDVVIEAQGDPKVPGVTCHISRVKADLSLADPSDMSISCRQTGPISAADIAAIDKSKEGEVVFSSSLSVLFKTLKVRRIYDSGSQTLLYLSYSTKETSGSHKHSLSTVPLFGTDAWQAPVASSPGKGN